jgi:Na+-transporting methylmalonyl-CoA/oxaloacetate decarboxylase beta subunit
MKNKKIKKVLIVLTVTCVIVTVINATWNYLLPKYIMNNFIKDLNVNTIGVIGAADGPVSILVSTPNYSYLITTIFALLSISGIVYLLVIKNKINKEDNDVNGV